MIITDRDRLNLLEQQAKDSYSGSGVTVKAWTGNAGTRYRLVKFNKSFPEKPTLREAIDAAMLEIERTS